MNIALYFLLLAAIWITGSAQTPPDRCLEPISFGKSCTNEELAIKYHFDNETGLCMAFKFNGCDGNGNNFESDSECSSSCKPTDVVGCPVNSKPLSKNDGSVLCKESEECGVNGYCSKRLSGGGKCCSRTVRETLSSDNDPACGTGRVVVKSENGHTLIGKTCGSNFCPVGSKCRRGTYFSTCCKKT